MELIEENAEEILGDSNSRSNSPIEQDFVITNVCSLQENTEGYEAMIPFETGNKIQFFSYWRRRRSSSRDFLL